MSTPPPSNIFSPDETTTEGWSDLGPIDDSLFSDNGKLDATLFSTSLTSPPSPPTQTTLVFPGSVASASQNPFAHGDEEQVTGPASDIGPPPDDTVGTEPRNMAPSSPPAANEVPESAIPELIKSSRPKQSRATTKKGTKRVAKPKKPLSANKQAKEFDKEGMLRLVRREEMIAREAAKMAAAQPQPDHVYGPISSLAGSGLHYPAPAAAGLVQQPQYPSLPPLPPAPHLASHLAPLPAPGPGHPSLRPLMDPGILNTPPSQPFGVMPPQNVYQQHQYGYGFFQNWF
ncbi:hypothetical protein F52700_2563 [Fusarium sp. NRRL 52700]|nr:hypothetical protein F52700_2563 [Fusarium sp. NRRL 52700]